MKKIIFGLSLSLLVSLSLIAKDTEKAKCFTKLENNPNFYIVYHTAWDPKDQEISNKADFEEKFVLYVEKQSFGDFFEKLKHSMYGYNEELFKNNPNPTIEEYVQIIKANPNDDLGPTSDYTKKETFEKNNSYFIQIYSTRCEGRFAYPCGEYSLTVYSKDGNIYRYCLRDPRDNRQNKEIMKQLSDYIEYSNDKYRKGYCWKSYDIVNDFYDDLVAKKSDFPEYLLKFQTTWEYIVDSIEE